jgi:hemolysin activation/secretion protein
VASATLAAFAVCVAAPVEAEPVSLPAASVERDGFPYPVSEIIVRYDNEVGPTGPFSGALEEGVRLTPTASGWIAPPDAGAPTAVLPLSGFLTAETEFDSTPPVLYGSAIAAMTRAVRDRLAAQSGLIGHLVIPDPSQIDPSTTQDLRPVTQSELTLVVYLATVGDSRTIGFGDRLKIDDDPVNHPKHRRVLESAPLAVGDLLTRPPIDAFVARLNRHPGRRVETAVAPTDTPGEVSLDYLITESKPWTAFAQIANTGTRSTEELRTLFGLQHTQLTGNDDVFTLTYVTAEFDATNAVAANYKRPLDDENKIRFTLDGAWNEYTASDIGLGLQAIEGTGTDLTAELAFEVAQIERAFVDVFTSLRWSRIEVDNLLAATEGDTDLLVLRGGVRFERSSLIADSRATGSVEFNLPGLAGTDESDLALLGRPDADASYAILRLDASHAFYLEPLLDPGGFAGERGPDAMSLAHRVSLSTRVQWTPERRLVANEQAIAGGMFTVRGYEEAIASGDSAFIATAEYRYSISSGLAPSDRPGRFLGQDFRGSRQEPYGSADWDVGLRAFVDVGVVDNNDRAIGEADETLVGVGIGLDARLWNAVSARADLGFALTDAQSATNPTNQGDARLHFAVLVAY